MLFIEDAMEDKKTLILIDGHALAFRQYYALERTGMKNSENQPTWAVYGFFKAIFDLLARIKPDFIAVAFDVGRQTFRVEKFEEYKRLHDEIWDEVVANAHRFGLRNYSIFTFGEYYISYFEYVGDDFERDMAEKALAFMAALDAATAQPFAPMMQSAS